MTYHDPYKHIKFLRQSLSQDKKPIAFFLSAGCPLAVDMPEGKWPLIPDVEKLTKFIHSELKSKKGTEKNFYDLLLEELTKANRNINNIEDILSFVRGLMEVSVGNNVRGFSEVDLSKLEIDICNCIVKKIDVPLPDNQTAYHKLASWISSIDREKPIEIFTTNYDLLMEQAFENFSLPYFDGFVGSRQSFFDLRALEENLIPKHWTRLWKIHGSINWFQNSRKEVFRSSQTKEVAASYLIYPSHLKYEQSRKMPYLALIDQLNRFLRKPSSLLVMTGYSFNDYHLNDTILNALKGNPTAMVIALLFDRLTYTNEEKLQVTRYQNALQLALQRPNLAIWAYDEAVIGTVRGQWKTTRVQPEEEENLGRCIEIVKETTQDPVDNSKTIEFLKYQLQLGDFAKFGRFLQDLIGYNQTATDEK